MTALAPSREALTACRDVTVTYGDGDAIVRALDKVDLEILPEDSLALLGRSGSGKTTLLHVLGGLVVPTGGTVEWHGRPLASLDAAARGAVRARPGRRREDRPPGVLATPLDQEDRHEQPPPLFARRVGKLRHLAGPGM